MFARTRRVTTDGMQLLARTPGCAAGDRLEAGSGQGPGSHGRQRRREEHLGFTHHPPLRATPRTHHVGRPRHRHAQPLVAKEAGERRRDRRSPYVRDSAEEEEVCAVVPVLAISRYMQNRVCLPPSRPTLLLRYPYMGPPPSRPKQL